MCNTSIVYICFNEPDYFWIKLYVETIKIGGNAYWFDKILLCLQTVFKFKTTNYLYFGHCEYPHISLCLGITCWIIASSKKDDILGIC